MQDRARERHRRTVEVKGVTLGEGLPKVFVPISGATPDALRAEIDALEDHQVDVVEWRADHFAHLGDIDEVVGTARTLAQGLSGTPLLFTCRTQAEGGAARISDEAYGDLNVAVAASRAVDLLDVEYARDRPIVDRIIAAAHAHQRPVIASNHDFDGTPSKDVIVARLLDMQRLGADICKIAVMPRSAADVLTLLDATWTMYDAYADRPLITMAMGRLGVVSRLAGQVFGSAATFGMVGTASAPGQIEAAELHRILRLLDLGAS